MSLWLLRLFRIDKCLYSFLDSFTPRWQLIKLFIGHIHTRTFTEQEQNVVIYFYVIKFCHLNNAEQAIKPFTIGRKNYLFCESVNGAKASAIIYSIVETAKANGLNVYKYLEFLITELSERKKDGSLDHIDDLLPWAKTPQKECKVPIKKS